MTPMNERYSPIIEACRAIHEYEGVERTWYSSPEAVRLDGLAVWVIDDMPYSVIELAAEDVTFTMTAAGLSDVWVTE